MKNDQTPMETNEKFRVMKTCSCLSLSGRSELSYEIGCNTGKDIFIRITDNTGSGMFSKAWVPLAKIDLLLLADDKPINSSTIRSFYTGSANSVGFLWAVLKDVGLIKNMEENSRNYVRTDPKKFTAEIHALMENESPTKKEATKTKEKKELPGKPLSGEAG